MSGTSAGEGQDSSKRVKLQTHIFKVFTRTEPGEKVLMRIHIQGGRFMNTLFLQQGTGTDSDWWLSEEVQLEVDQTASYGYVIRSSDGADTLEAHRRSLPVKRSETRVKTIADGAFKHKVQRCEGTVTKTESIGAPAPGLAQGQVSTGKLFDPEPSPVLAGVLEKCEQFELQLASIQKTLLAEVKASFEEVNAKVENMENRINVNADSNAQLELAQAELKTEFVTKDRVDRVDELLSAIHREVGNLTNQQSCAASSLRENRKEFEAVGESLRAHTHRLAAVESEAERSKKEVGTLWDLVRANSARQADMADMAGLREEQGARIQALEHALTQHQSQWEAVLARSSAQNEVQVLQERFRDFEEWQKADKDELKGSIQKLVERQRKTRQQVEELEKVLNDMQQTGTEESHKALQGHLDESQKALQGDVQSLRVSHDALQGRLDESQKALQGDVQSLGESHKALEGHVQSLREHSLQSLRECQRTLQGDVERLQQRHGGLEGDQQSLQESHRALQGDLQRLQEHHSGLQGDQQGLQESHRALQSDVHGLGAHHAGLQSDVKSLQEISSGLRVEVGELKAWQDELQSNLQEQLDKVLACYETSQEAASSALAKVSEALQCQQEEANKEAVRLAGLVGHLEEGLQGAREDNITSSAQLANLHADLHQLKQRVEEGPLVANHRTTELKGLQDTVEGLRSLDAEQRRRDSSLQRDLTDLKDAVCHVREQMRVLNGVLTETPRSP